MAEQITQSITNLGINETNNTLYTPVTPEVLSADINMQPSSITHLCIRLVPPSSDRDNESVRRVAREFDVGLNEWIAQLVRLTGPGGALESLTLVVEGVLGEQQWTPLRRFLTRVSAMMARNAGNGKGVIRIKGVEDSWGYKKEMLKQSVFGVACELV